MHDTEQTVKSSAQSVQDEHANAHPEAEWPQLRERLRRALKITRKSVRKAAEEMEMSASGLSLLLRGITEDPQASTVSSVEDWVAEQEAAYAEQARVLYVRRERAKRALELDALHETHKTAQKTEAELLEYFLEHHEQLAAFMSITNAELDAGDRRKMTFAMLNGLKRAYIRAGEEIPPVLFDLERRLLAPEGTSEEEG